MQINMKEAISAIPIGCSHKPLLSPKRGNINHYWRFDHFHQKGKVDHENIVRQKDNSFVREDKFKCCTMMKMPDTTKDPASIWNASRNIWLILGFKFFSETSRAIWSTNILSSYLYLATNENAEVIGLVSAAIGISQLVSAIPAGFLADKYRRDTVSRVGAIFGFAALVSTCVAVYQDHLAALIVSLSLWGIFLGIASTSTMAMFVDSIPDGSRSRYFTYHMQVMRVAQMMGPSAALLLFGVLGNNWTIQNCSISIVIAQAVCLPAVAMLCFTNDNNVGGTPKEVEDKLETKQSLTTHCYSTSSNASVTSSTSSESDSDEECHAASPSRISELCSESTADATHRNKLAEVGRALEYGNSSLPKILPAKDQLCQPQMISDQEENTGTRLLANGAPQKNTHNCWCGTMPDAHFIPLVVACTDIATSFSAGMSVRYFPIFFMKTLRLPPTQVQILYIVAPFGQIVLAQYAQKAGKIYGRSQTTVFIKMVGVALFFAMIFSYEYTPAEDITVLHKVVTCVLYLLRTIFMNCTQGLTRSILMEAVPKAERAKWSSLESLSTASWAASAYIGGILVERCSISVNFYTTATLQFFSALPLVLLFKNS